MIVRGGLRQVALGVVIGVVAALALTRVMASMLCETSPTDPVTFVTVAAALILAGTLAGWVPARRASKADPIEVLRVE